MPATKYKSNNAYEPDYERYSRDYSRNRTAYYRPPYERAAQPSVPVRHTARPASPQTTRQKAAPAPERAKTPTEKRHEAAQKKRALKRLRFKTIVKCAVIFGLALAVIYRYVMISELGAKINSLQNEYAGLSGDAQEIQSKIDKSIDLGTLETRAQEDLGMVRPDRNQIFYVDMNGDDYGESTNDEEKSGSISSASGSMIRAIDMIK